MDRQTKWDLRYLALARFISSWSKDPSTQVGACIADQKNRLVSAGFNGLPRGVHDTLERLENRELKYPLTVHAEVNALLFAGREVARCSLYVWPLPPCAPCAAKLIQAGIRRIVTCYPPDADRADRWGHSNSLAFEMLEEAGASITFLELGERNEFEKV
jgi:dCMP deaminase